MGTLTPHAMQFKRSNVAQHGDNHAKGHEQRGQILREGLSQNENISSCSFYPRADRIGGYVVV